ncbi:MAG TPA: hypothetical protein P5281_05625 [Anaerovoracaceae bacterium]|nr:hypothetical protein [Anaerovoracaceae bacterium]
MKIVVIILIIAVLILMGMFIIGMAIVIGASEEMYRDYDDRDQAEYIRRWQEKRNAKRARKKHR